MKSFKEKCFEVAMRLIALKKFKEAEDEAFKIAEEFMNFMEGKYSTNSRCICNKCGNIHEFNSKLNKLYDEKLKK